MKNEPLHKKRMCGFLAALVLAALLHSCAPAPKGFVILCAGDSLTEKGYPSFLQKLMKREGWRVRILNFGRSGNASGEYLKYLRENKGLLAVEHPDFILLQLGTNDVRTDNDRTTSSQFYENMKQILGIFRTFQSRKGNPAQILIAKVPPVPEAIPFPFSTESTKRIKEEINPLIEQLSQEANIPLVDNNTIFIQLPDLLSGIHPNRNGYKRMAANWLNGLKPFLVQ